MAQNINGVWHAFSSAEIDFGGKRFLGIQALNWKEDIKKEVVKGSGIIGLGYTQGDYEASADFEILYSEWIKFTKALGDGWGYRPFNVGCQYRVPGKPLISVSIPNVTINGHDVSNSKGPAPTTVKVTLLVIDPIVTDGTTIFGRPMVLAQRK
jgi:hypothetical protein